MSGVIYCGDNLEILREPDYIASGSVDLIYLDPPFNSQRTYNLIYKGSKAQEEAFKDYWSWSESAGTYAELVERARAPLRLRGLLKSLHALLIDEDSDLLAYLVMMSARLVELHRVLKPTGSLYLHCDPTASHYLKLVLDALFGSGSFQNEIIWRRTASKGLATKRLPTNHDTILLYAKGEVGVWNGNAVVQPYDPDNLDEKTAAKYCHRDDDGRVYRLSDLNNPNKDRPNLKYEFLGVTRVWRWTRDRMQAAYEAGLVVQTKPGTVPQLKRYLDEQEGRPLGDVWTDIAPLNSQAKERIGYPTQKPLVLLERIILASSNPGSVVLDAFCGCGTTIEAAERLGRRWIGIDIARKAVEVIEKRFERVALDAPKVIWHPADWEAAAALAERDKDQFEAWALRRLGVAKRKKDLGGDGEGTFLGPDGTIWRVIVQVKGGKVLNPAMVRELRGTIESEGAHIGVLFSMYPPTKEMELAAAKAMHTSASDFKGPIPRLQILTAKELFEGGRIRVPGNNVTPKADLVTSSGQLTLPGVRKMPIPPAKTKVPAKKKQTA